MKQFSLVLVMFLFAITTMVAQKTVSGTVTDSNGEPLIGANVVVKGTTNGAATDLDGKFSISNVNEGDVLEVTYTGFDSKDVVVGASSEIGISLSEGITLDAAVVTALGIRKEKKALGYAVTTLESEAVEAKPESDVARILRGKVPGIDITSTSGLAGSGTNVIIRGYSSITGSNQPLFVVDGVPFNTDTNNDRGFTGGSTTASSRFLDLDPNNISEISVLKGLSATVLYGEAGRNGVVLVTTKNNSGANRNKKLSVSISQSVFATNIANLPDYQNAYGNGFYNGASPAFSNWGAPFDEPGLNGVAADGTVAHPYDRAALNDVFPEFIGARYDYKPYDSVERFFETGVTNNTSVNINSAVGDNTSINGNYGFMDDQGFTPGNDYTRHNFGLGTNTQLDNGLKFSSSFNFASTQRNSPPAAAGFGSNPTGGTASLFSNLLYTPRSVDLFGLPFENPVDFSSVYYRGGNDIQNPRWTLKNINDNEKVRRFFGNFQTGYQINEGLSATYRIGIDAYSQQQRYTVNKGGIQIPDGLMQTSQRLNFITDHQLNLNFDYNLSEDFNLSGIVGANIRREKFDLTFANSTQQFVYGLFRHNNFIEHDNGSFTSDENTIGLLTEIVGGYKNFLYVTFSGRNDWTSTLEDGNRSIFYPSVSASVILSDAIPSLQESSFVDYMKLRVGYGTSAGYPSPYATRAILGTSANAFNTTAGTIINTNSISNTIGNPDLRPELVSEFEVGVDARFLQNRIGLDFSYYNKSSDDLIIDLDLDPATGFTSTTVNAASVTNTGVEIGLRMTPVRTSDGFQWDINANFTRNVNIVQSILDGVDQILIAGFTNLGNFAIPGEQYGAIQGSYIQRDDNGNPIVAASGDYLVSQDERIIGNPIPDFQLNGSTSISWKGLSARAQVDYVHGGDIYSTTAAAMISRGLVVGTDYDRFTPIVLPGVKEDGTPNDIQITSTDYGFRNSGFFIDEQAIYDGTTIRLREVSLSYNLPKSLLKNTPFGGISLTLAGQNLWFKAVNFPDAINFDPEVLSLGVGNGRGFDFLTGPTAKRYGATLKLTF